MRIKSTYFILLSFALLSATSATNAQQRPKIPSLKMPKVTAAQKSATQTIAASRNQDINSLPGFLMAQAVRKPVKFTHPRTRGPQDEKLYEETAAKIVLIRTERGIGSGSLLKDNQILTCFHVIDRARVIAVQFFPADPNGIEGEGEVVRAKVVKVDKKRDLALLELQTAPPRSIPPLEVSAQDVLKVGADVHAIGHPHEENWTYTKGYVSQIRIDYTWNYSRDDFYIATVVQTQTPINGGNSGGPLWSNDGKIVGVNAFGDPKKGQNINFAVSAKDIRAFLANPKTGLETENSCNQVTQLFDEKDENRKARAQGYSIYCDKSLDLVIYTPDDKNEPVYALVDLKRRGEPDLIVFDEKRTGKWDFSYWDENLDGTYPRKGIHSNGELFPSKFEPRCPKPLRPIRKFECSRI